MKIEFYTSAEIDGQTIDDIRVVGEFIPGEPDHWGSTPESSWQGYGAEFEDVKAYLADGSTCGALDSWIDDNFEELLRKAEETAADLEEESCREVYGDVILV